MPDVHVTATGRPDRLAAPSAKNPAQRSSMCDQARIRGSRASDRTIGVQRDPGAVHACSMPQRASSSQKRAQQQIGVGDGHDAGLMARDVVLLHGFTNTGASWDPVVAALAERYRALAPDIRGHGAASARRAGHAGRPCSTTWRAGARPRFTLVGYSMGGRIALHAALAPAASASSGWC